jgi:glycosyltransferase involved in cell wall biosynthesis
MKTVCFDLRALQIGHQNRGIGMYIRSVLENMPKDDNRYLFYCFDKNDPITDLSINTAVNYEIVQTPTVNTALDSPRQLLGIIKLVKHRFAPLKSFKPDVFVQFDFTLGAPRWKNTKVVAIGYDLIPLIKKNEYMPSMWYAWSHSASRLRGVLRAAYYRFRYHLHYKVYTRADTVVCISQSTADTFSELLGIPKNRLATIPLAPVTSNAQPDDAVAKKMSKPYVFYIGGTDKRKRVIDIIRAFNIARGRGGDLLLVLAGFEFQSLAKMTDETAKQAIKNSPYADDIKLVGFITDAEKLGLYAAARAFVFASTYEGFGLPVVEAMAASCPVIAYNNSSIPEASGNAAILIETGDYVEIARQLIALDDAKLRNEFVAHGLQQAEKFSWKKHVAALTKVLDA